MTNCSWPLLNWANDEQMTPMNKFFWINQPKRLISFKKSHWPQTLLSLCNNGRLNTACQIWKIKKKISIRLWGHQHIYWKSIFLHSFQAWQIFACGYKTFCAASHGLCLWPDTDEMGYWAFAMPHHLYTWPGAGYDQRPSVRCPPIDLDCFITPEMPAVGRR